MKQLFITGFIISFVWDLMLAYLGNLKNQILQFWARINSLLVDVASAPIIYVLGEPHFLCLLSSCVATFVILCVDFIFLFRAKSTHSPFTARTF
jgi:hypothetical protein